MFNVRNLGYVSFIESFSNQNLCAGKTHVQVKQEIFTFLFVTKFCELLFFCFLHSMCS